MDIARARSNHKHPGLRLKARKHHAHVVLAAKDEKTSKSEVMPDPMGLR